MTRRTLRLFTHVLLLLTVSTVTLAAPSTTPVVANKQSVGLNDQGVQAIHAKDFVGAESLFKKALDLDPRNATAAYNLAGMYLQNKKPELALTLLKGYVQRAPDDAGIFARLGDAYFASKRTAEAQLSYEKALQLDPAIDGVARKLATLYVLRGKTTEAEKLLVTALKQSPGNNEILSNLSSVYYANGKTELAINSAKQALQSKPSAELYVTLGLSYERLKDYQNSLTAYQKALVMDGARKDIREKITELSKHSPKKKS